MFINSKLFSYYLGFRLRHSPILVPFRKALSCPQFSIRTKSNEEIKVQLGHIFSSQQKWRWNYIQMSNILKAIVLPASNFFKFKCRTLSYECVWGVCRGWLWVFVVGVFLQQHYSKYSFIFFSVINKKSNYIFISSWFILRYLFRLFLMILQKCLSS